MSLSEYLCLNLCSVNSMPRTKQHLARQTPPSAPPNIICCSCTCSSLAMAVMVTTQQFYGCCQLVKIILTYSGEKEMLCLHYMHVFHDFKLEGDLLNLSQSRVKILCLLIESSYLNQLAQQETQPSKELSEHALL